MNANRALPLDLYFIAGTQDCRHVGADPIENLLRVLQQALQAGIDCYQFRDKGKGSLQGDPKAQREAAYACRALCRQYNTPFVMNDEAELAYRLQADGIHVGQGDKSIVQIRQECPKDMFLGLSVNTLDQALRFENEAAVDYFGVGPIFATQSKADHKPPVGLQFIQTLRSHGIKKPLVAIGSVKAEHVGVLRGFGANGVAVISAIAKAPDIAQAVRALKEA